jgi:GTPase SAR1 family protein
MAYIGTCSLAEGKLALTSLIDEIKMNNLDWNEAETRFQIIDRIITDCLGWPREMIRLEQPQNRKFSDYELGTPRRVIWEAKKEGKVFDLPANANKNILCDLASIIESDSETREAIEQVQGYCIKRGVDIAVVTNGKQIIAFFATRTDGLDPLQSKCLVLDGYDQLLEKFSQVWQTLSPEGVFERRLYRFLKVGEDSKLPEKLSHFLYDYPKYRYPSDLQYSLSTISELLLNDIIDQEDVEKRFYQDCYCESGALSQHALVSKQLLSSRYQALFNPTEKMVVSPATRKDGSLTIDSEVIASSIRQRPIVLIGDVGVGKTSFIKHLMLVSASNEFKDSIYIYINLGSQGALTTDLKDFILTEVERQLYEKYAVDVREASFVRGVYDSEIKRFENGIFAGLKSSDPSLYTVKLMEFLEKKMQSVDMHLKSSIEHIAKGRKKQIVIALDNADQRNTNIQQEAFIIAQNFSKEWQAVVFVTVRPHTFFQSKKSGTLAAYPPRVFTILPPRVDQVIERRLKFALDVAEGKIQIPHLGNIQLNLVNIATFIRALLFSLNRNERLVEFLSNITGGNIREVIGFVTRFIGSPNVDADKIIDKMENGGYVIPLHEFWKSALLGEYSHYDPMSSIALNLFDIISVNQNEHFLTPMILGYLNFDGKHKNKDGFVITNAIITEMQNFGFSPASTTALIQAANNKKLIETAERVTFDEGEGNFFDDKEPENFRITTVGAYHLKRWISEFAYLDAMSHDTPILNEEIRNTIKEEVNSFSISDRLNRALTFRGYLTKTWHDSNLRPSYFDWDEVLAIGEESFNKVQRAIANERLSS